MHFWVYDLMLAPDTCCGIACSGLALSNTLHPSCLTTQSQLRILSLEASVQESLRPAYSMAGCSTMLQQRPCKSLLPAPTLPRPERVSHRVMAQAQPAKPTQPNRANTALQASAVADAPPAHTSRVSEKPLGEGPTVINGQVQAMPACQLSFVLWTGSISDLCNPF